MPEDDVDKMVTSNEVDNSFSELSADEFPPAHTVPTPESDSASGGTDPVADALHATTDPHGTHDPSVADTLSDPTISVEAITDDPESPSAPEHADDVPGHVEELTSSASERTPDPDTPTDASPDEFASGEQAAVPKNKKWYVVKVTSGREESIKAAIERRVKIEGLEEFYGQIVIPVERVTEVKKIRETKNGEKITKEKRVIKERKKFPGYIMAEVEFNDRILYLFRETSGVADFVGAAGPLKPPPPMTDIEVRRMLGEAISEKEKKGKDLVIKLDYEKGDKVRIREGAFANMEGEVKEITIPKDASETPKVKVEVTIFGRGVPVDLDYWQVDKV
mgnify:CR=1 FL=1